MSERRGTRAVAGGLGAGGRLIDGEATDEPRGDETSARCTTAVILAAGAGTRIGAGRIGIPKPLTRVLGASLLCRAIDAAQVAGVRRVAVVTGYQAARVEAHVRSLAAGRGIELEIVRSDQWMRGNGSSLLAAETAVAERCIVLMADHLTPPSFLRQLSREPIEDVAGLLVVDRDLASVHDLAEATKVRLDGTRIVATGKELDQFDAIDTGVFAFDQRVFGALRSTEAAGACELSAAVQRLADAGLMRAVAGDGSFWCDVDTPEDLAFARRSLARSMHEAIVDQAGQAEVAPL